MRRRRSSPEDARIEALIAEIKDVNEASKFQSDPWERERLLAEKSTLQSELLREWPERFELLAEGRGIVGILGRDDGWDACHAIVDKLDPDVKAWVKAQLKRR